MKPRTQMAEPRPEHAHASALPSAATPAPRPPHPRQQDDGETDVLSSANGPSTVAQQQRCHLFGAGRAGSGARREGGEGLPVLWVRERRHRRSRRLSLCLLINTNTNRQVSMQADRLRPGWEGGREREGEGERGWWDSREGAVVLSLHLSTASLSLSCHARWVGFLLRGGVWVE